MERICVCGTPMSAHSLRGGSLLNSCWLGGQHMERTTKAWWEAHIAEMIAILDKEK